MKLIVYFTGSLGDSAAERYLLDLQNRFPSPLLTYLRARLEFRSKRYGEAAATLQSIKAKFASAVLNAGKEQLFGQACFFDGRYQPARSHFWQSLNFISNEAGIRGVMDWLERCEWFELHANLSQ